MPDIQQRYPRRHLAACELPWTPKFDLDEAVFERHVKSAIDSGHTSFYLMGTAGEGYALSDGQFRMIVEAFAAMSVRDGLDPQVGVISTSMRQVIERVGFAYDKGIRMFQISMPSWGALDESEAMLFFKTVCGTYPDARFLHYNLPRAGRIIRGPEYRRIADNVPNLVATKNSTSDYTRTADLIKHAPDLQHFLLEINYAMGCTVGPCSLLCSFASLYPKTSWRYFEAGLKGDFVEAFRICELFRQACDALAGKAARAMIDGAYDKTFVWLRDPTFPTRLLPPYFGMSRDDLDAVRREFDTNWSHID